MQDYISVGAISTEFGISRQTISKKLKELGIDSRKITQEDKELLYNACKNNFLAKEGRKDYEEKVKLIETDPILTKSGSTLEERLIIAKREFDNLNKSLLECQIILDTYGHFSINGDDNKPYPNNAMKTKIELLKQHNALQKTIQELEDKKKLSISSSIRNSVIDD